jgi:putative transposase
MNRTDVLHKPPANDAIYYAGCRSSPDVIGYAVWLCHRFPLSLRMVAELLGARGIKLIYETVRRWSVKFDLGVARPIRANALVRADKWHLDEGVVTINGSKQWLRRAVDQHGAVLDLLAQSCRDRNAVRRLIRKLLVKEGRAPRVLIPDKLRSYAAANRNLGLNVEHRQHKGLNNRAENSHQPMRGREKIMRCFKSARHLQRFASVHGQAVNLFMCCRCNTNAQEKRRARKKPLVA